MIWKLNCGTYTVFVIEDGYYWRDTDGYHDEATEHDWRFHPRNDQGQVRLNFGCYLITDGHTTVMVDAGLGEPTTSMPAFEAIGRIPDTVEALGFGLGSVETVVGPPATTSHVENTPEERAAMGIPEGLIRYSVGIEDTDDLIADLSQALG